MLWFLEMKVGKVDIHSNARALLKGALSHFRILLSILLIILNNLQVIQVLAAK